MENWARCHTFGAVKIAEPASVEELQDLVSSSRHVGVIGAAHSFNDIADTPGTLVDLRQMATVVEIDPMAHTVTAEGGIRYHVLCQALDDAGFGLHNLMSIPHFSVVGACATGTHGSGDTNGALATAIAELEFVDGSGELHRLRRGDEELGALATSLGALGIVTSITLDIEPRYDMAVELLLDLPNGAAIEFLDELMASAYSVSYFTDWQSGNVNQVWRKHRLDAGTAPESPVAVHGARPAAERLAPSGAASAHMFNEQQLVPGPWHRRLPHLSPDRVVSPGAELQSEYFVERRHGRRALEVIAAMGRSLAPVMVMSEVRSVAPDELWLSPFGTDRLALHFSWRPDLDAAMAALPALESALEPFSPLPHWGKLHTMATDTIRAGYPRFRDFVGLAERFDPERVFRNGYLDEVLGP